MAKKKLYIDPERRQYFERHYLESSCFDTLEQLFADDTSVEVNAPRALLACRLEGVWIGLNDLGREF